MDDIYLTWKKPHQLGRITAKVYRMNTDKLLLDTPLMDTAEAARFMGLSAMALHKRRSRQEGPNYHLIGEAGPGKLPRVRYSLRNLIEYAMTQDTK